MRVPSYQKCTLEHECWGWWPTTEVSKKDRFWVRHLGGRGCCRTVRAWCMRGAALFPTIPGILPSEEASQNRCGRHLTLRLVARMVAVHGLLAIWLQSLGKYQETRCMA